MTPAEAGRIGGLRTAEKHGAKHFSKIGKRGGVLGGNATMDRHGTAHYERIGAMGGAAGKGKKR